MDKIVAERIYSESMAYDGFFSRPTRQDRYFIDKISAKTAQNGDLQNRANLSFIFAMFPSSSSLKL